tara:strand:+ start:3541 stop:3906 length:366 start_codon:yes stop_codon:yes gene_type:complete
MGLLTAKLTLSSKNATTDSLNLVVSDELLFSKDVLQKRIVTSTTATKFLEADDYGKCYVYLHNYSSTAGEIIHIRTGASDSANIHDIGPEEFIFFSWSGDEDLNYDAAAGNPVLEMYLFEV